jgi:hypothetical protein
MSRADRTRGATQTTPIWTATDASEIHLAAAQIGGYSRGFGRHHCSCWLRPVIE